jgi:threonine synthase
VRYVSTRGSRQRVTADIALRSGIASDGGLFLPETLPSFAAGDFDGLNTIEAIASHLLAPFFAASALAPHLDRICRDSLDFPVPIVQPDPARPHRHVLELFHGPTGAFKDFGARFLLRCFAQLHDAENPLTILVATSGDTGGAVGCAAEAVGTIPTVILFPKGRISAFQEQQLGCWRKPVTALRVAGDFDACQSLVKSAFSNPDLSRRHGLTSANSINIGRFLPQMSYWAKASLDLYRKTGERPGLVIPTGNLGNAFAALLARACGLPIGPVVLATNANATLVDWHQSGEYLPRASIQTLANAMDVGAPSNFERLARHTSFEIHAVERVTDSEIKNRIRAEYQACGYIACPHTATALEAHARLPDKQRSERAWILGATANPYKFADRVSVVIGDPIAPPPQLAAVLDHSSRIIDIPAEPEALDAALAQQS